MKDKETAEWEDIVVAAITVVLSLQYSMWFLFLLLLIPFVRYPDNG